MSVILLLSSGGVVNTSAPIAPVLSTSSSAITPVLSTSITISVSTTAAVTISNTPSVAVEVPVSSSSLAASSSLFVVSPLIATIASPPSISGVVTYLPIGVFTGLRYLRPSGDTSTGSWSVSPLWSKVDESIYDDSDFITSEVLTSGTTSIAKLALTLV